jgi:ribose/xylose/arabinose/galactoside ABC-type transport system permease subunit
MSAPARPWQRPWFAPLVALAAVYALFCALSPETFARPEIVATMARQTAVVAIASLGMTVVIAQGGIDLSVGSGVALTTVIVAWLLKRGFGPLVASAGGVAALGVAGLLTGLAVTRLRITPFIVTLGTMSVLRGAAKGLAAEQTIVVESRGLEQLLAPPGGPALLVPAGVWLALGLAVAVAALLHYTRFGRYVYAVGSSEATARLAGVDVTRVRVASYLLAALLTGVAGVVEFSKLTVGDPTDSAGLELAVIASVVIGGASLSGGEGSVAGALVGAFLMTVIKTGSTHLGLSNWVQEIVTGLIIVLAVALDGFRRTRR